MSWLNSSFNTLKGTITTLAQEVLAEHDQEEEDEEEVEEEEEGSVGSDLMVQQVQILEQSERKIKELTGLCISKDDEIVLLRQLISDLRFEIQESQRLKKMLSERDGNLEDSWFWEPDNVPSPDSPPAKGRRPSGDPDEEGAVGGAASNNEYSPESKLAKLTNENLCLFTKLAQLENDNRILNRNLDELEAQHNMAIQNVLAAKNSIQQNFQIIAENYEIQKTVYKEKDKQLTYLENEMDILSRKFDTLQISYTRYAEENLLLRRDLENTTYQLNLSLADNTNLKVLLTEKDNQLLELIERIESDLNDDKHEENANLKKKLQLLTEQLEELENGNKKLYKMKSSDISSSASSSGKHSEDEFIVLDDENIPVSWEQKYNELIVDKAKYQKTIEDLEIVITELKAELVAIEEKNSSNLHKIETLKGSESINPEVIDEIRARNIALTENLNAANFEFKEYQDEQVALRKELDEKILNLEDKLLDMQERNLVLETGNREQILELEKFLDIKTQDCEKLLAEKIQLEVEVENLNLKMNEFDEDICNIKESFEMKIFDMETEIEMLRANQKDSKQSLYETDSKESTATAIEQYEVAENISSSTFNSSVDIEEVLNDFDTIITENEDKSQDVTTTSDNTIQFTDLQKYFTIYMETDLPANSCDSLETAFKIVKKRIWKINVLERNLKDMAEQLSKLSDERIGFKHKIATLKADNENYKIECEEMTKNNGMLLEELELYSKKLQPIPENNEEAVVILEKQIDDITDLNKSLEEGFNEANKSLEEQKNEILENNKKIETLEEIITNLNSNIELLKIKYDTIEVEKCNLIFEINEMKAEERRSHFDSELSDLRIKVSTMNTRIEMLKYENQILVGSVGGQEKEKALMNTKFELLQKLVQEKESLLVKKKSDIENYKKEYDALQAQLIERAATEDDKLQLIKVIDEIATEKKSIQKQFAQAKSDNQKLLAELKELKDNYESLKSTTEHEQLQRTLEREIQDATVQEGAVQLKNTIDAFSIEKQEMVATVQQKHTENMQYYQEIQRLSKMLDTLKSEKEMLKDNFMRDNHDDCDHCIQLKNATQINRHEFEKLNDKNHFLSEKSDILQQTLISEQTKIKRLQNEKQELLEQKASLARDLERLREHLVDLEECHTKECIEMESVIQETKSKMLAMEEAASKLNNAYTSGSIRANQHAETIQAQYMLLNQQRDDLANKLSAAEDRESKNQAALVNLQCALEQFQRGKEKDIDIAIQKIRRELKYEKDKQECLVLEISGLKEKLLDANKGLLAAARISDQLEISKDTITYLKYEIDKLTKRSEQIEHKLHANEMTEDDKVEKGLIKSLLINYMISINKTDQTHILRVISSILEFNPQETERIGLNRNQTGWFGGVAKNNNQDRNSLAEAFVEFLEKESQPRQNSNRMPNLLAIVNENMASGVNAAATTTSNQNRENKRNFGNYELDRKLANTSIISSALTPGSFAVNPFSTETICDNSIGSAPTGTQQQHQHSHHYNKENIVDQEFLPLRNSSSILKDILNDEP